MNAAEHMTLEVLRVIGLRLRRLEFRRWKSQDVLLRTEVLLAVEAMRNNVRGAATARAVVRELRDEILKGGS